MSDEGQQKGTRLRGRDRKEPEDAVEDESDEFSDIDTDDLEALVS